MQHALGRAIAYYTGDHNGAMRYRELAFMLVFLPVVGWAQVPAAPVLVVSSSAVENENGNWGPGVEGMNPETRSVLLANCPKDMAEADWLRLLENPVNRSFYPLRITQAMLDTLDGRKLDLRYRYVLFR